MRYFNPVYFQQNFQQPYQEATRVAQKCEAVVAKIQPTYRRFRLPRRSGGGTVEGKTGYIRK